MSDAYIGEIRLTAFTFAPKGWMQCNGQILAISANQALFALLGTYYGGDGIRTFQLPDLRGRVLIGTSSSFPIGAVGGSESVTLTTQTIPMHTHGLFADATTPTGQNASTPFPNGALGASGVTLGTQGTAAMEVYGGPAADRLLDQGTIASNGAGLPHENRQPFQALNYCIAIQGYFPPRN